MAERAVRNRQRPMRAEGFSHPAFVQLADLAHLLAGLVFPSNRQPSAEAGMRRAMATLRISEPDELLRVASAPGAARDTVLAELTVGESYFFRDATLPQLLLDTLLTSQRDHNIDRPLRIWSAGCASGEEPYTIAILIRELSVRHVPHIVGTDVARPRLAAAARARYTRWALRGVSGQREQKWFRRTENHFELEPAIRDSVRFGELNLVDAIYAIDGAKMVGYDLVLCRNVMIYFDLATAARIAERLLDALSDEGWLVLGASDPPLAQLVSCEAVVTEAGLAYRRHRTPNAISTHGSSPPPTDPMGPPPLTLHTESAAADGAGPEAPMIEASDVLAAYQRADYPATQSLAMLALSASPQGENSLAIWILQVRAVGNQGRMTDAGTLCSRALEFHPLSAELHYLHAMLLLDGRWHSEAVIAARRAIYLDRSLAMAHLLLGDALSRVGDCGGARIAFDNVLSLLKDVDPAVMIPAADGVSAPRLRQLATLHLGALKIASGITSGDGRCR